MGSGNGFHKSVKSPLAMQSARRMHMKASVAISSDACRRLDISAACEKQKQPAFEVDNQKLEGGTCLSLSFDFL